MIPNAKAWLASIALGLLVGGTMWSLIVMGLPFLFDEASPVPIPVIAMSPYITMVVASLALLYARDMRHRCGWGLSIAGAVLLLTGFAVLLPANGADPDMPGAVVPPFLPALPFAALGITMTAVGMMLLRRKPGTNRTGSSRTGDR